VIAHALGVDEGAVDATEVLEQPAVALLHDLGVGPAGGGIGQHDVALLGPAHAEATLTDGVLGSQPGAMHQDQAGHTGDPGGAGVAARAAGLGGLALDRHGNREDEHERVDEDLVTVLEVPLAEGLALEVGAVAAADVLDGDPGRGDGQAGVAPRDRDVGQHQAVVLGASDVDAARGQRHGHVRVALAPNGELDALRAHGTRPPGLGDGTSEGRNAAGGTR
jgi:hypothetical protein